MGHFAKRNTREIEKFRKAAVLDLVSLRLACYHYVIAIFIFPREGLNWF